MLKFKTPEEMLVYLQISGDGNSDSSLLFYPYFLIKCLERDEINLLLIERKPFDAVGSLIDAAEKHQVNVDMLLERYQEMEQTLNRLIRVESSNKMVVKYEDINHMMFHIHLFLTPDVPFDLFRLNELRYLNIQQSMKEKYESANF